MATNGATLDITGVDFRKGTYTTAPAWDFRSYQQELNLAYRYYFKDGYGSSNSVFNNCTFFATNNAYGVYPFKTTMRASPTLAASTADALSVFGNGTSFLGSAIGMTGVSPNLAEIMITTAGGGAGTGAWSRLSYSTSWISFNAEL